MPLKACGSNGWGQLGLGHADDVATPQPVQFKDVAPTAVVDLASGSSHTLLIVKTASPAPTPAEVAEAHKPHKPSPLAQPAPEADDADDDDNAAQPGGAQASEAAGVKGGNGMKGGRNTLLAAGTNTHGQLGVNCVLWNETRRWTAFRPLDLLGPLRRTLELDPDAWHPVRVACCWTTSFVVYERLPSAEGSTSGTGSGNSASTDPEQVLVVVGSNDFGERAHAPEFGGEIRLLRPGERIVHLAAGQRHVVAVLRGPDGQRVMGWGGARHGQLGHAPTLTTSMSPREVARTLTSAADLAGTPAAPASGPSAAKGKGKGKAAQAPRTSSPVEIPLSGAVTQVAVGSAHTLLLADGRVRALGSDAKGQIRGLDGTEAEHVAASWGGSYVLRAGAVRAQGADTHGQLCGAGSGGEVELPEGARVRSITAGSEHLVVVLEDGRVLAGGWNEHGNLGLGDAADRHELAELPVRAGRAWAGCATTFLL